MTTCMVILNAVCDEQGKSQWKSVLFNLVCCRHLPEGMEDCKLYILNKNLFGFFYLKTFSK